MLYLLDTANVKEIEKAAEVFPLAGVTTNPSIIAQEKRSFFTILKEIRAIIDEAYEKCREILARYKTELTAVAEYLLEHETMERDAFLTVFGEKTHEQPENVPAADAEDQD